MRVDHRRHRRATAPSIGHDWGDVALLYRKHEIGDALEARVPQRRHPVPARAGTRAVRRSRRRLRPRRAARDLEPDDDRLPRRILRARSCRVRCSTKRARRPRRIATTLGASSIAWRRACRAPTRTGGRFAARSPIGESRRARQASHDAAIAGARAAVAARRQVRGRCSTTGTTRSRDPARLPDVVALAARLAAARERNARDLDRRAWAASRSRSRTCSPPIGCHAFASAAIVRANAERIEADATPSVGLAARRVQGGAVDGDGRIRRRVLDLHGDRSRDDGQRYEKAEIVEIAAVRVRDGQIVETYSTRS